MFAANIARRCGNRERWTGATVIRTFVGVVIRQIFISPGHNYFGHAGREPDDYPLEEVDSIECVAGRGIRGDRFFDYRDNYKGQITFFSQEVFDRLAAAFPHVSRSPGSLRRNVIVSGAELNALIGEAFELQGVQFLGTAHCKPCFWLDTAFAPGTEAWLKGNGGLRAQILTDGVLQTGNAELIPAQREFAI
jgi:MOSC domain-containing protein YiiM